MAVAIVGRAYEGRSRGGRGDGLHRRDVHVPVGEVSGVWPGLAAVVWTPIGKLSFHSCANHGSCLVVGGGHNCCSSGSCRGRGWGGAFSTPSSSPRQLPWDLGHVVHPALAEFGRPIISALEVILLPRECLRFEIPPTVVAVVVLEVPPSVSERGVDE